MDDDPESDEDILNGVDEFLEALRAALQPLEIEGGPAVDYRHLGLFGLLDRLLFESKGEATKAITALEECWKLLARLKTKAQSLPEKIREDLEHQSDAIIPIEDDDPDPSFLPVRNEHRSLLNLLEALQRDFDEEKKRVVRQREALFPEAQTNDTQKKSGRGKAIEPYATALAVGRIYMELRGGEVPTVKLNEYAGKTDFEEAVNAVFKILGFKEGYRGPCSSAAEKLTPAPD